MPNVGPLEFLIILIILALFVLPVVTIVWVFRSHAHAATPERDPAIDVLRQRFAKGEIDEVEYQRLRTALQGH